MSTKSEDFRTLKNLGRAKGNIASVRAHIVTGMVWFLVFAILAGGVFSIVYGVDQNDESLWIIGILVTVIAALMLMYATKFWHKITNDKAFRQRFGTYAGALRYN